MFDEQPVAGPSYKPRSWFEHEWTTQADTISGAAFNVVNCGYGLVIYPGPAGPGIGLHPVGQQARLVAFTVNWGYLTYGGGTWVMQFWLNGVNVWNHSMVLPAGPNFNHNVHFRPPVEHDFDPNVDAYGIRFFESPSTTSMSLFIASTVVHFEVIE